MNNGHAILFKRMLKLEEAAETSKSFIDTWH